MADDSWISLLGALRAKHEGPFYASKEDFELFTTFVERLDEQERITMLLHSYDRYRALSVCGDPQKADQFETSCWSILISTILQSRIQPDAIEACQILEKSYHGCGHGSDVEPPLTLAEKAFQNQPYSKTLFYAAHAYQETLRGSRSTCAANVKRKLSWILWHDPRRIEKICQTQRIQRAIHSMDSERAFHWQWLLRHTAAGLNSAPGKYWLAEGRKRLARIGEAKFLSALDSWFQFPDEEATISAAGSAMLRLLVWYGVLADPEQSLPTLLRLTQVSWNKRSPVGKVMAALAWALRTYGGMRFEAEAGLICAKWAADSAEVKRLEQFYFPSQSEIRRKADEEFREQQSKALTAQFEAALAALRELNPHVFGPDGPARRLLAAREVDADTIQHSFVKDSSTS
jgi:hypothetical protein